MASEHEHGKEMSDSATTKSSKPDPLFEWVLGNISYALPLTMIAVAALRLYITAGGDSATLEVLAANLDIWAIFSSSFLQVLPRALLLVGMYLTAEIVYERIRGAGRVSAAVKLSALIVVLVGAALASVDLFIWMFLYGSIFIAYFMWEMDRKSTRVNASSFVFWAVIALTISAITNTSTWLPSEVVTLKGGKRVVGYVVATGESEVAFLYRDEKKVSYIPNDRIVTRSLCSDKERSRPLITYILQSGQAGDGTERCPETSSGPSAPPELSPGPPK
ncbi:MFS transporter [Streptomyces sp. Act143]|uniref:MFS transporter n=1 Tax=Streptomyces sp. Act143 TaxID=2200760 RepID=UPI0011B63213|nr:MFS transporter [Streptomyces sp. Act143]